MGLNNLASSLGLKGGLAGDATFLILFVVASFVLSFILGKHRILVSLLGVYAAYAVVTLANFDVVRDPANKTLLFLAVLIGFIVMFSRLIRANVSGAGPMHILKLTIGSAIIVGLTLAMILTWYPAKSFPLMFSANVRGYFSGDLFRFLWAIAPLVYLGIVRKRID